MSTDTPTAGRCNAHTRDGEYCEKYPMANGRCHLHGGATPTKDEDDDVGAPDDNVNAMTHGLYVNALRFYEALDAEEQEWVDNMYQSLLDETPPVNLDIETAATLKLVAIKMAKRRHADEHLLDEGMIQIEPMIDDETGDEYVVAKEHPLHQPLDRLDRQIIKGLREAGILNDEEMPSKSLAQVLSKAEY